MSSAAVISCSGEFVANAPSRAGARDRWISILYLVLCAAVGAAFFLVPNAPLLDVPNHAARMFVICNPADPVLARMYAVEFGIIPNIASDILLRPLCGVATPWTLQIVALVGAQAAIAGAAYVLHRHLFGSVSPLMLIVPALGMNIVVLMGYVNYLIGTALAFWLFTYLVVTNERRLSRLAVIGTVGGTALFFSHLFSLLLMLVLTTGWMWQPWRDSRILGLARAAGVTALAFALPLMLALFVDRPAEPEIGWGAKARVLLAFFYTGDIRGSVFVSLLLGGMLLIFWRRGSVALDPRLKAPLFLLAAVVAIIPGNLGDAVDVDSRLMAPLAMLFVAAVRLKTLTAGLRTLFAGVAGGMYAAIAVAVATVWLPFSDQVSELRTRFAALPAGAPLLTIRAAQGSRAPEQKGEIPFPYWHLASYALMDRQAFNPLQFTARGMQPLRVVGPYRAFAAPIGQPLPEDDAAQTCVTRDPRAIHKILRYSANWCRKFTWVLHLHMGAPGDLGPTRLQPVANGSFFTLSRIDGPKPPAIRQPR